MCATFEVETGHAGRFESFSDSLSITLEGELSARLNSDVHVQIIDTPDGRLMLVTTDANEDSGAVQKAFSLVEMDDLKLAQRADGSYPYIWEALVLVSHGDELRLEQQEVHAAARGKNLALGTLTLRLLHTAAKQAGYQYVISEPVNDKIMAWHLRLGEYRSNELQPAFRERFAGSEVAVFICSADPTGYVLKEVLNHTPEDRAARFEKEHV